MKKLVLLTAVAIGYVLGTRAGRGRYEQIKKQAEKVWHNDSVQSTVDKAQDTAMHTASDVGHRVAETAKDVSSTVTEKAKDASSTAAEKVKTASHFSKDDKSASDADVETTSGTAPSTPAYSTSSEGLRAGAAEADARAAFDIDEAGSDDLAAKPNPLGDAGPTDDSRA